MTDISKKISELEVDEANIIKQLGKFDVDTMEEADEERFDELEAELESTRKKLSRLKRLESIGVDKKAKPAKGENEKDGADSRARDRRTTVTGPNGNIPKGINFARSVICLANAQGSAELAATLAEKHYPDDKRIANFLRLTPEMKAAVPAAYVGDAGGWAEDIAEAQTVGNQFIEFLRPMTIVDRINAFRRVPFNVKVPRMTSGQSAYWVGEAKPAPLTSGAFDLVTMGYTKVGAISALSKEQMRFSNINAESSIRDDLASSAVAKLDTTFIGVAAASAGVSPAGLLNGVTAQASAGDTADDVRADLAKLFKLHSDANIGRSGMVYVTTETLHNALFTMRSSLGIREFDGLDAAGGTLNGIPIIASNHVGGGDLIAISAPNILLADDGSVDISLSDQASLEMLDGSLEQDGTSGAGAATAGVVSLWQAGLVAIKVERFINWQKSRAAAVQFVGDATYLGVATA